MVIIGFALQQLLQLPLFRYSSTALSSAVSNEQPGEQLIVGPLSHIQNRPM